MLEVRPSFLLIRFVLVVEEGRRRFKKLLDNLLKE
jgi:hypothetical protein